MKLSLRYMVVYIPLWVGSYSTCFQFPCLFYIIKYTDPPTWVLMHRNIMWDSTLNTSNVQSPFMKGVFHIWRLLASKAICSHYMQTVLVLQIHQNLFLMPSLISHRAGRRFCTSSSRQQVTPSILREERVENFQGVTVSSHAETSS